MPAITWRELQAEKEQVVLIDTRTPAEFSFGTIPGAVNIPVDELRNRLNEVPIDKPVVLFCAVGLRGYLALRILTGHGYKNVRNLSGGYKTYAAAVAPVPPPTPRTSQPSGCQTSENASVEHTCEKSVLKILLVAVHGIPTGTRHNILNFRLRNGQEIFRKQAGCSSAFL